MRAEESSSVLAFRIFVMLSCLIVVPMAAIFGSAFPDVVKSVLVDRIVAWSTGKPLDSTTKSDANFSEVTTASSAPASRRAVAAAEEAPRWNTGATSAGAWPTQAANSPSGVVPAGGVMPGAQETPPSANLAVGDTSRNTSGGYPLQRAAAEIPYRGAAEPAAQPVAQGGASGMPEARSPFHAAATPPGDQPDRFTAMERKLRDYGATYYLLETWGNEGDLYRFHCKMAVGNNPNYARHFEATDRDALKAMSQVLEKVEAWRAGRLP